MNLWLENEEFRTVAIQTLPSIFEAFKESFEFAFPSDVISQSLITSMKDLKLFYISTLTTFVLQKLEKLLQSKDLFSDTSKMLDFMKKYI